MTYVGIRQLKAQLSKYVRTARQGEEVVITDHGKPVARLVKGLARESTVREKLVALAQEGLVILPTKPWRPRKFAPVPCKGKLASDMIIEDRR
ncbi:MAG: type II toxin-antitoxin system prevent-host-death family antitoxin [Candidatus Omnitrophica bacterium]|nr:type II toxin-antitoxin system prevent-host-death family antitoxin [Candidatus Omnitrophota bacterium]